MEIFLPAYCSEYQLDVFHLSPQKHSFGKLSVRRIQIADELFDIVYQFSFEYQLELPSHYSFYAVFAENSGISGVVLYIVSNFSFGAKSKQDIIFILTEQLCIHSLQFGVQSTEFCCTSHFIPPGFLLSYQMNPE